MAKVGRPKKNIDYDAVEKLASLMCTQEEIGSFMDVSVRTLQRDAEFCRVYKKGLDKGKISLRRKQFNMSERNPAMAIWLGKQYLGQSDQQKITHDGKFDINREFDKLTAEELRKLIGND